MSSLKVTAAAEAVVVVAASILEAIHTPSRGKRFRIGEDDITSKCNKCVRVTREFTIIESIDGSGPSNKETTKRFGRLRSCRCRHRGHRDCYPNCGRYGWFSP